MHHVAIMKPELRFLEKVLSGQKTIESRWLHQRCSPWHQIKTGDTIFFKNSGQPVSARATVERVLYFDKLTPSDVRKILAQYGKDIGIKTEEMHAFYKQNYYKQYCVLMWLENVQPIVPFAIKKQGFGAMAAWLSVENIAVLRVKH